MYVCNPIKFNNLLNSNYPACPGNDLTLVSGVKKKGWRNSYMSKYDRLVFLFHLHCVWE